ncbi:MAG: FAD-binding protein [Desulfobacteraceae bacterium]|nr:FAD-binding protein [Desulfobacteraceae bacterium]
MTNGTDILPPFDRLAVRIEGEVCTAFLQRYMLSTDASIFRKMPAAVVYPRNTEDVARTVRFAARHRLSVHARGAGSGLCGAAVGDGIVVDFTRHMNRLLRLDEEEGWFECEPGYRMGELAADIEHTGLFFPPDPSSGEYATFGGMTATNASGAHSVKYGNVADYLLDAEIVFADGEARRLSAIAASSTASLPAHLQELAVLYETNRDAIEKAYPPIRYNVAGYNLRGLVTDGCLVLHRLFAGAEGTLGIATRLRFRLISKPAADSLVVAFFDDILSAARAVQQVMPLGPSGIEIMDKSLLHIAREVDGRLRSAIPGDADNVLLIEFDGATSQACAEAASAAKGRLETEGLTHRAHLAVGEDEKKRFWAVRQAAVPLLYKLKGRKKIIALVEDATVPVHRLVEFFEGLYAVFERHGVRFVIYGHIAKGLLHSRPLLDLKDPADVRLLQVLADEVYELVSGLDGTVSGEHGDGRLRTAYVRLRYPLLYPLFQKTKELLDPEGLFNPDIKLNDNPSQMAEDLRFGASYRSADLDRLHLNWDEGFCNEAEKCHGCSKCTTTTNATRMCPVYKFTREESASPKAKANVLRAIISGAMDDRLLHETACRRVMDLCVNCGSCRMECPSNVNIPKLAMEAKAQYVARGMASVTDRITAHVGTAARLLHRTAPLIAPVVRAPAVRALNERLTGLSAERDLALFDKRSLYARVPRVTEGDSGRQVLYYAGCYAGYMRPEVGVACVETLQGLGFTVHVPPQGCCGLPAVTKGMSAAARRQVNRNLSAWRRLLGRVEAVAVTCSSCGYALMQDWRYLVEGRDVEAVSCKTVHITRLLQDHRDRLARPFSGKTVAYHQPCHLRLQKDARSSIELLAETPGLTLVDLRSHCCGMAGSWGLAAKNQTLSRTIGGQMASRLAASGADWAVTDCPTCEMQMRHMGSVPVRHPVEMYWERNRKGSNR